MHRLGGLLGLLAALLLVIFGLFQTGIGQAWLAGTIAQATSGPGFSVAIVRLGGIVPFRMTAARIDISDTGGRWLSLESVGLDLSLSRLLTGYVDIRSLRAAEVDVVRFPSMPTSGRPEALAERLRVPHLPIALALDRVAVGRLALAPAILGEGVVATAAGSAELAGGTARLSLDLRRVDGSPGKLALTMAIAGVPPVLNLRFAANEPTGIVLDRLLGRTDRPPLALTLSGAGPLSAWRGRLAATAGALARFEAEVTVAAGTWTELGITGTAAMAPLLPAEWAPVVGDRVAVSLHARLGQRILLDRLALETAAGKVTGDAAFGGVDAAVAARLSVEVPKLSAFAGLIGTTLDGAATMTATVSGNIRRPVLAATLSGTGIGLSQSRAERIEADLTATPSGTLDDPKTRFALTAQARIDGLAEVEGFAPPPGIARHIDGSVAATATRDGAVVDLVIDRLALADAGASLTGDGRFDSASHRLAATLTLAVPRLESAGIPIAGEASARLNLDGPLDRLRLTSAVDGSGIAAAGARIDHFHLAAQIADLAVPKVAIDGTFRAFGLDGRLALAAERNGNLELDVPSLRLTTVGSTVAGNLRIALDSGLVSGILSGRIPDLARWSEAAGTRLGGSLDVTAGLEARAGQGIDVKAVGTRLSAGTGSSHVTIGGLALSARLADIWHRPAAAARISLSSASLGAAKFTTATATVDTQRSGHFAFAGDANGHPLTFAFAGAARFETDGAEVSVTRLSGMLGNQRIRLEQPLTLTRHRADLVLSGLALELGPGRITGSGARRDEALSLTLEAEGLPISSGADLLGYRHMRGTLSLDATIGGSLRAPRGHIAVNAHGLAFALPEHSHATNLGLDVVGNWNGRAVALKGRVTGLNGDRMGFSGSLPLMLTAAPFGVAVPREAPLALRVEGGGELGHIADLLPLGEDRLSGRFAADVALGGTVAAPAASGRLTVSGARYANFASGTVLTDIDAQLVGNRDRFTVVSFSATDGAAGHLAGNGSVVLDGVSGPTAELSVKLVDFRLAARDEALVTASGTVTVTGPLTAPKVTAPLTVDRADINLPQSLPPSVVVLKVVEIGGKARTRKAATVAPSPSLPAALDITLDMPGRVFVRGHGLDSEWRGRLRVSGTDSAVRIVGSLTQIRGSFNLLGKSFQLTRGTIVFDGGAALDPALDIVAEASAADITAQVNVGGFASAPTITLTSTPPLPKDEVLSRVLFNRGVGQITPGEGLQLAQAAATLAGAGPGVLDRLRGGLGLDWLRLGEGPSGPASSILNPAIAAASAPASASGGTALSAGKYVAPGVSVGVTQGISPPTSKVTVEIRLGPHVTVETDAGQNGGTGVGLNYQFDY